VPDAREKKPGASTQISPPGWWYLWMSKDGITGWERHPKNPIIIPSENEWDEDSCYKPYAVFDGHVWRLWYNGRLGGLEQIGMAIHEGDDLGF